MGTAAKCMVSLVVWPWKGTVMIAHARAVGTAAGEVGMVDPGILAAPVTSAEVAWLTGVAARIEGRA